MAYTMGQAAKAAGVSKATIQRALKSGKLSATRQEDGTYQIDPAELHRAFPRADDGASAMNQTVTARDTGQLRLEVEMLREHLALLASERDDLRQRLDRADEERRQAQERLTALLTDQRPATRRRKWWPWG